MSRLMLVLTLHIFIGSTLAGSAVIFSLTLGYDTLMPIIVAACIGFFGAFPVSVYVAKQITKVV
jgi:hypothetical protein